MVDRPAKSATALRTIGELSTDLGVPQHILRYWEARFTQLKPMQRAGNRRYYRPDDVALARRIHRLLTVEGYTVKGVQQVLAAGAEVAPPPAPSPPVPVPTMDMAGLRAIRDRLSAALADDLVRAA